MKKILCPTDFSKTSTRAMEYAAYLASLTGASLTLLHTIHLPLYETSDEAMLLPEAISEVNREATEKLNAACRYLSEKSNEGKTWHCTFELKTAILADAVRNMVTQEGYDFVVLGSTGGGNTLEEILIGSNTQAVIENAVCPVLTIPTNAKTPHINRITYASDLYAADKKALEHLIVFAEKLNADIEVVHIDKKEDAEAREKAAVFAQQISTDFAGKPIKFTEINHPDETEGLKEFLTNTNTDLLVILKKHRGFFSNLFHTSLAEELTYHAKFPMLILDEAYL